MQDEKSPNWKSFVRERIGTMRLTPAQEEEIVTELSAHLEDAYIGHLENGLCKTEALERSLGEVANWPQLAREIQRVKCKEGIMNNRTKQLWLPMLVCIGLSLGVLLFITTSLGRQGFLMKGGLATFLVVYVSWLVLLPACSAASAALSRKAGAKPRALLSASLFPAGVMLCFIGSGLVITLTTGARIFANPQGLNIFKSLCLGVVVPSAALWLGARPFLKEQPQVQA